MKITEALQDGVIALFDIDGRHAMKRKYRAMCDLIDPETGITKTSKGSTVSGAFGAVWELPVRICVRRENVYNGDKEARRRADGTS